MCAYAIDMMAPGTNLELGCRTVDVPAQRLRGRVPRSTTTSTTTARRPRQSPVDDYELNGAAHRDDLTLNGPAAVRCTDDPARGAVADDSPSEQSLAIRPR